MDRFKRNLPFGALLTTLAVGAVLSGWFWRENRQISQQALATLEQKRQERDRFARQSPALSEENEQAIVRDLANSQQVLAALRDELQTKPDRAPGAPPDRAIDLYFELAAFVEKTRAAAARAQVVLKSDERFGFASYAHEGPEAVLVAAVHRQLVNGGMLIEALIEAHPTSVLAVQRERPLTAVQRAARDQPDSSRTVFPTASSAQVAADYFDLDPARSARVAGLLESDAYRVEFTGQTPVLRTFLNALATGPAPVVVRSVAVEPQAAAGALTGPAASVRAADVPMPLIGAQLSRFSVVLEVLQLIATPAMPAP